MDKIVVIGGVSSTYKTLLKLIDHDLDIVGVFGLEPKNYKNVSGYISMQDICEKHDLKYFPFEKINEKENVYELKALKPDIIFAVGLSQILGSEILQISSKGNIGFHPTLLPKGRGRAPIAWIILNESYGAANFFLIDKGVDDGPIFIQKKFKVDEFDDASTIEIKMLNAIDLALDDWLPRLKQGEWSPIAQEDELATEYGRRAILDGVINWYDSAIDIDKLIRATSKPHPGAITFYGFNKIKIWKSEVETSNKLQGVIGRVLKLENDSLLIQTGSGLLWIHEYSIENVDNSSKDNRPLVGSRFGYYDQYEIYKLKNEIEKLKQSFYEFTRN